jgi:diguanylate cyclase (GGDEF)-like protein
MEIKQLNRLVVIILFFALTMFFTIFSLYSNYSMEVKLIDKLNNSIKVLKIEVMEYLKKESQYPSQINYILTKNRALNNSIKNIHIIKKDIVIFSTNINEKLEKIQLDRSVFINDLGSSNFHNISGVKVNLYLNSMDYILYVELDDNYNFNLCLVNLVQNVLVPLLFFGFILFLYYIYIKVYLETPILSLNHYIDSSYSSIPHFYITEFNEISKVVEVNFKKLFKLAYKDSITQLENRNFIEDKINNKILNQQPFYLVTLNVQNFRKINDLFGFLEGDRVIKTIANILKNSLDSHILTRITGADFAILCENDKENLIEEINIILERFKKPIQIKSNNYFISLKIGISSYPDDGKSLEDIFKTSQIALNEIKKSESDSFLFFNKSLLKDLNEEQNMKIKFNQAVKNDEFEIFYQPKIDIIENKPISAEALIRWNTSEDGLLESHEFIAQLGSCCIKQLEEFVLKRVIKQQLYWKNVLMFDIPISINIDIRHLLMPDFITMILDTIENSGIDKNKIIFEISEIGMKDNLYDAFVIIDKLSNLGINFCLDNFKIGNSSFEELQKLSVNTVKLDKSLISYIDINKDTKIVHSVILLAKFMKKNMIAVGVENMYQVEYLKNQGVNILQGDYFSRALSVEDFEKYMSQKLFN